MNLFLLIAAPILTALGVALCKPVQAKAIALAGSVVQLLLAIGLYVQFTNQPIPVADSPWLFQQQYNWFTNLGISLHIGVDGMAVAMILLTAFVVVAGVLVSWQQTQQPKEFFIQLLLLSTGAYGFFISLDLFVLFFFLELAVIPKYLLIGIWGSGKKEYAANKLALLLMFGSSLVLAGMLGIYFGSGLKTFDIPLLLQQKLPVNLQTICFPLLFAGFGVFTALFPFHTWVPDGHSSAPTAGSMFLAGISMKLGGFGCIKVALLLMPEAALQYSNIIIVLATIAILYGAFATLMQTDLKYMNAYSSISHCGFVILGLGMLTQAAVAGAIVQMVSHGLMTALFFAVIGMLYQRTHTRIINQMGGLQKSLPFICTILFLVGFCSLGLPGLSGFVAEMMVFTGAWQQNGLLHRTATVLCCMSIVVTAVYILRAVTRVAMGALMQPEAASFKDAQWNEKLAAILLLGGILAIGIAPGWLVNLVSPAAELIIQKIATVK
jgi:NADH-quinone oxidoreductase subunit M